MHARTATCLRRVRASPNALIPHHNPLVYFISDYMLTQLLHFPGRSCLSLRLPGRTIVAGFPNKVNYALFLSPIFELIFGFNPMLGETAETWL